MALNMSVQTTLFSDLVVGPEDSYFMTKSGVFARASAIFQI